MSSLFDLTGKVAIVTGSSRGIGRAIAERLAEHGAQVVISSRKAGACEEVKKAINAKCGEGGAIVIPANIWSKDELLRLVEDTTKTLGKIDILVCNAASNPYYGPMAGISADPFPKIPQHKTVSNHCLIRAAVPQMLERKDGWIIIISSIGGLRASTVIGAYCVSKAADMALAPPPAAESGPP